MRNTQNITVYAANCRGNAANCLYPYRMEITDEDSAVKAFSRDIVCAEYRDNYRSVENFLSSNTLPMDCDNDHSDNPEDWITAEALDAFFPGVPYIIHYSRNHNKQKGKRTARPRFHVFFLIDLTTDPDAYAKLKKRVADIFPYKGGSLWEEKYRK